MSHPIKNNCEWFAMCWCKATTTRKHPVLGDVPICAECNDHMDKVEGEADQREQRFDAALGEGRR